MSATVAAALKKIAVSVLSNPKLLKKVLGIVLVIIIAVITPILALVAILRSEPILTRTTFKMPLWAICRKKKKRS